MAELLEQEAAKAGYTRMRTKSMNQYRNMMILNLKRAYTITAVEGRQPEYMKFVFEKDL
jgi:hypothetical protein